MSAIQTITARDYPPGHPPLLEWLRSAGLVPEDIPKDDFSATDETGEWVIHYRTITPGPDGVLRDSGGRYLRTDWQKRAVASAPPSAEATSLAHGLRDEATAIRAAAKGGVQ